MTGLEIAKARVAGKLWTTDSDGEPLPEFLLGAGDNKPSVIRFERLEWDEGRVRRL